MSIAYAQGIAPDAPKRPVFHAQFGEWAGYGKPRSVTVTTKSGVVGCMGDHVLYSDGSGLRSYGSDAKLGSTEPATVAFVAIKNGKVLLACKKCAGTMKRLITQGSYSGRGWELALQTTAEDLAKADLVAIVAAMRAAYEAQQAANEAARLAFIREEWDAVRQRHLVPTEPGIASVRLTSADEFGCVSVVLRGSPTNLKPEHAIEVGNLLIRAAAKAEKFTKESVKP